MGLQLPRTGWEAILTPAEFQAWRERLGLTRAQSAELGRRDVSKTVELACRAVEADRSRGRMEGGRRNNAHPHDDSHNDR